MTVLRQLVRTSTTALVAVVVVVALVAAVGAAAGYRPQPVLSGSMEPGLPVGSLAIAKAVPAAEVMPGDVITFARPNAPGETITHRVHEVEVRGTERFYRTKGDANPGLDPWTLRLPDEVGAHVATVPDLGYVALYAAKLEVRIATIALLALLLLLAAVRRIWRPEAAAAAPAPAPAAPRLVHPSSGPALHAGVLRRGS